MSKYLKPNEILILGYYRLQELRNRLLENPSARLEKKIDSLESTIFNLIREHEVKLGEMRKNQSCEVQK